MANDIAPAAAEAPVVAPGQPFVRAYQPEDADAMLQVFETTADSSLSTPDLLDIASYLYLRPYTYFHASESVCLVLDSGRNGPNKPSEAVGYIIGAKDTHNFVQAWKDSYLPELTGIPGLSVMEKTGADRARRLRADLWRPEVMEMERWKGILENFPAHLHINILPQYQRNGNGRRLMHAFCDILRAQNVPGVHLGMVATNSIAEKFYAKMGYERFPEVMDGGASGQVGRTLNNTVYLVGKLD